MYNLSFSKNFVYVKYYIAIHKLIYVYYIRHKKRVNDGQILFA